MGYNSIFDIFDLSSFA